jgi:hypothetical protein
MPVSAILINAIAFQLAWFAALYGGILNSVALTILPAFVAVIWHIFRAGTWFKGELALVSVVLVLGFAVESIFIALGAITYIGAPLFGFGPPVWIMAMWLAFGTLPHGCLTWLQGKWVLQFILGGLFGPLSYLAGAKLGAATLSEPMFTSLAVIALGWALALPAIFWLAVRLSTRQNGA